MKERPIIFSAPMVRAILEGRKTQTRRPVKSVHMKRMERDTLKYGKADYGSTCPYGGAGDRLWVRETWQCIHVWKNEFGTPEDFDVPETIPNGNSGWWTPVYRADEINAEGWRPSIFMPRWASRIILEVLSVRVERLQDISKCDAVSEGTLNLFGEIPELNAVRASFAGSWQDIYKNLGYGWDVNPCVWVIEFKRLDAANG